MRIPQRTPSQCDLIEAVLRDFRAVGTTTWTPLAKRLVFGG